MWGRWSCVLCVGQFGGDCGAGGVVLCVWDSLWGECGAGGVVLCVWGSLGERMSGR